MESGPWDHNSTSWDGSVSPEGIAVSKQGRRFRLVAGANRSFADACMKIGETVGPRVMHLGSPRSKSP